jgi:hypothetical protein
MQLKIKLLHVLLVYVLIIICIIYIHITGYIRVQKHVLYGQFEGFSRVILTIRDFGFTHRL